MRRRRLFLDDWLKEQAKRPGFKKGFQAEYVRARLAVRIAELRRKRNLSQAELARRLRTTQQVVSDIETFKQSNLTLQTLEKIARALESRLVVELR